MHDKIPPNAYDICEQPRTSRIWRELWEGCCKENGDTVSPRSYQEVGKQQLDTALSFEHDVFCCCKLRRKIQQRKQTCSFVSTTNSTNKTNPIVRNQWTQAFYESNVFGKTTQHVYVSRFVSFAERLRSLSCLVYALHSLHLLHLLFHPSMKEPHVFDVTPIS